jgi:DNA-directed RNA polymerase specialized sigma24 family protein
LFVMTSPSADNDFPADLPAREPEFPTTHWTLVTRVRQGGEIRRVALEELCRLYWYPIYVFLRRRGFPQHDAEDLTQGFFVKLLHDATFDAAQADKGRLRTFLLCSLDRHLADQKRRQTALKRGGGQQIIAFEELHAEERYALEPQDHRDPEWLFTRAWAQLLLDGVRDKLRESFDETGRAGVFEALLPFLLWDDAPPSYREVAQKLDSSETAVRLLVFRLRAKFREFLREEVGQTVSTPQEVESEMEWLKSVFVP